MSFSDGLIYQDGETFQVRLRNTDSNITAADDMNISKCKIAGRPNDLQLKDSDAPQFSKGGF